MSYDPAAFDAFEAAGWAGKEASAYDALAGRVTSRLAEPLLDAVDAGARDAARSTSRPGPGYVAAAAVARGAEVVGLDLSEAMLEFARERVPEADVRPGRRDGAAVRGRVLRRASRLRSCSFISACRSARWPRRRACSSSRARGVDRLGRAGRAHAGSACSSTRSTDVGVGAAADVPAGPPFFRFADEDEFTRLLAGAGLEDAAVETVDFSLRGRERGRALGWADRRHGPRAPARACAERRGSAGDQGAVRRVARASTATATASRCRSRSSSARGGSRDRPRASRRRRAGGRLDPELHGLGGGDGGAGTPASARSSGSPCSGSRSRTGARTCSRPAPAPAAGRR